MSVTGVVPETSVVRVGIRVKLQVGIQESCGGLESQLSLIAESRPIDDLLAQELAELESLLLEENGTLIHVILPARCVSDECTTTHCLQQFRCCERFARRLHGAHRQCLVVKVLEVIDALIDGMPGRRTG